MRGTTSYTGTKIVTIDGSEYKPLTTLATERWAEEQRIAKAMKGVVNTGQINEETTMFKDLEVVPKSAISELVDELIEAGKEMT